MVIPVFNAYEALQGCLASVSATLGSDTQVIVIDDGSSDPRIDELIRRTVEGGGPRWRHVRQPRNLGFVATANLGMRLSCSDVVLLNSDAVVFPGWLDRMARC
ncbi:MAG: glycosyltransferase, partial [Xanthomonadales bacterium]|nr:glycosyltransferase [Xanthomonadales bacterium]